MIDEEKTPQTSSLEWVIIIVFLALIAAPGIGQLAGFSGAEAIWAIEYRIPNPAPSMPSTAKECVDFPATTDAFFNDSFGFRSFLGAVNGIVLQELGSTVGDEVLVGKDGWLFHHKSSYSITEEYRGAVTVTDEAIDTWVAKMREAREATADLSIDTLFVDRWTPQIQKTPFGMRKRAWIEESGFYRRQKTKSGVLRFTDGNGKLVVPIDPAQPPSYIEISLVSWGTRIADFTVIVNGTTLTHERIRGGEWSRTLSLSGVQIDDTITIELVSDTFIPAELSDASNDTRVLGVCVRSVRLLAEVKP